MIPTPAAPGVDATKSLNIHTLRAPGTDLAPDRGRDNAQEPVLGHSVIGVWSGASRRKVRMIDKAGDEKAESGPWVQVSRLGNPLFNEVIVPLGKKDLWNVRYPTGDKAFENYVQHPELASLLPKLYPTVFPNLQHYKKPRADLDAILLTGIPKGIITGFQNYTGKVQADQLRLNVAIPPTNSPNRFGLLGNDLAGFPNGRRVSDDVVAIELESRCGRNDPAGRQELHAGRRGRSARAMAELAALDRPRSRPLPVDVPISRNASGRVRHTLVVTEDEMTEAYSARKHPEFVVLEIGEDVGALIVHADPELHGTEIEISPERADHLRSHKEVLERSLNGSSAFTAVFDAMPAGSYTLWMDGRARSRDVSGTGGEIVELDWRLRAHHFPHLAAAGAFTLGTGLTAYTLGLRHAFDADHISAIDNTTRKLMSEGRRPLSVGFFFSLGHSTVGTRARLASRAAISFAPGARQ